MRNKRNPILVVLMVIILILGIFVAYVAAYGNLGVEDSGALFGGRIEKGYLSAGFLVVETQQSLKTCGFSAISNQIAVTAAHCVDDARKIFMGLGQFTNDTQNLKQVRRAVAKANWVESQIRSDDFAVLTFPNTGYFSDFAKIAAPSEGCIARVVAYGRTEDPIESITKPRKSALLCVSEIGVETFRMTSDTAGICFGDSGSPIYRDGTNELIGVVVSIVKKDPNDTQPCAIGNTAIAVRVDANQRIIQEQLQADFATNEILPLNTDTVVDVANETFLERLGLNFLENLSTREKETYLLVGVVALIALLLVTIGVLLSGKKSSSTNYSSAYEYGGSPYG